jgi:hypothetical protein
VARQPAIKWRAALGVRRQRARGHPATRAHAHAHAHASVQGAT